ncbi:hypothetical protein [Micromonospora cathayae]|uniref:Uncharacterized protein n=1 Tax=Micromonospora cathayae TaxID=3028804 RepID=A0ABY7ZXG4_9ACTN|nr:hypothetical protein [Micromonospora sp. HUAS 3]WDZ86693.1 hypothetical protein PVK37_10000 [Micromonospora sp. HUAS 3]
MNPTHVTELLERAASSVTPTEADPSTRLVDLGRRSVRRRRRTWGAAGSVAAATVAATVVALPLGPAAPDRFEAAKPPTNTVHVGDVSVNVPAGWRTSTVATFDPCTAEQHTVYLAERWNPRTMWLRGVPPQNTPVTCEPPGRTWLAVVRQGAGAAISPNRVMVRDRQMIQVEQPAPDTIPSMLHYRAITDEIKATTVFISGNDEERRQLLRGTTWPPGPPAPPSGGLALPGRITSATTDAPPSNGMVVATDAKTLNRIRALLAELRDPVPADEVCTIQKPGAVGISLGDVTVVLGDSTCPQAVSTGGGHVRSPAGLGRELLDLIVASDRAATERSPRD